MRTIAWRGDSGPGAQADGVPGWRRSARPHLTRGAPVGRGRNASWQGVLARPAWSEPSYVPNLSHVGVPPHWKPTFPALSRAPTDLTLLPCHLPVSGAMHRP